MSSPTFAHHCPSSPFVPSCPLLSPLVPYRPLSSPLVLGPPLSSPIILHCPLLSSVGLYCPPASSSVLYRPLGSSTVLHRPPLFSDIFCCFAPSLLSPAVLCSCLPSSDRSCLRSWGSSPLLITAVLGIQDEDGLHFAVLSCPVVLGAPPTGPIGASDGCEHCLRSQTNVVEYGSGGLFIMGKRGW